MEATAQRLDYHEERIDHLDAILGQFIASTGAALNRLEREMREFKGEMSSFKDEMREYKDWSKASIQNLNQQWGNLARKMGTLVEDIFFPSSDIVIEKYFGIKPYYTTNRNRSRQGGEELEVDILAKDKDNKTVFIFEIKSNPDDPDNIKSFQKKIARVAEFFPELQRMKVHSLYGGLTMRQSTLNALTNSGIYGIVFKGDVLEVPNYQQEAK